MKKITFLMVLMITALGFSQEILTNGDFETGVAGDWYAGGDNGVDIINQGGNFVHQAVVASATDVWRVNLSQAVTLEAGKTYEFSFDAFTDAVTASRSMIAGIGEAGDNFESVTQNPALTPTPQTFTYQMTVNYSQPAASRVLFDMGGEPGSVFIDNVSLVEVVVVPTCTDGIMNGDETGVDCGGSCPNACPVAAAPTVPAPTPPGRAPEDVVNIYSAAYADGKVLTPDNFGVASNNTQATIGSIMGDDYWGIVYNGGDFIGLNLDTAADASGMTHFHMDYWVEGTPVGGVFNPKWSNHSAGHLTGETSAAIHTFAPGADGQWNSLDIEITQFNVGVFNGGINPGTNREVLSQLVMQASGAAGALFESIYLDNVYFHNNMVLSTETVEIAEFKAFPNPTNGDWNISSRSTINSIAIFDMLGKQVITLTPNANETVIKASQLNAGVYFARIDGDNGTKTLKLIKQ